MPLTAAVIGGGASGLVTLKYLLETRRYFPGTDIQARLFDANDGLGGAFKHQSYTQAELVSSKYLTAFSDFRLPATESDFLTTQRYVHYLEDYANEHGLWEHIQLSTTVTSVRPHPTRPGHIIEICGKWCDENSSRIQNPMHYDVVAVCTGLNHTPSLPGIPGLISDQEASGYDASRSAEPFVRKGLSGHSIRVIHSSQYNCRIPMMKKATVLILGVGETAMDIGGLEIVPHSGSAAPNQRVIMCHRSGFIYHPKVVPQPLRAGGRGGGPDPCKPNKPLDCTTASLFDTAYVPPVIQSGPWLWNVYDFFVKGLAWSISGTSAGLDQWVGGIDSRRFHTDAVIFCKSDRAMPYISAQYRSQSLFNKLRTWLINVPVKPTQGRKIDLAPWPSHFDLGGVVHFQRNDRPESKRMEVEKDIKPDLVIFATGYKQSFLFLPVGDPRYPSLEEAATRGIYRNIEDGIAYIGFVRPALGAIPPLAELQAQHWIHALICSPKFRAFFPRTFKPPSRSRAAIDSYELDYELHCRDPVHDFARTKRAVDMDSYAYQLALDMGAASTWLHVWCMFGREVLFTWAMGPNFATKFRLIGPWADSEVAEYAASLMRKDGELGKLVRRTGGGIFFFMYTIVPLMIFGPLCIVINSCLLLMGLWKDIAAWPTKGLRMLRCLEHPVQDDESGSEIS